MSDSPDSGLTVTGLHPEKTPEEGMLDFQREIARERAAARAYANTHTPIRGKVEIVTSSTPMAPRAFETPRGRQAQPGPNRGQSIDPSPTSCPFGEIITWEEGEEPSVETLTGIRGGVIYCGDQNWNMDPQEVDPMVDGVWLVYFTIPVEVNMDDDAELLLPGVSTGTQPTGDWDKVAWSVGVNYPDNTPPTIPTGGGTIIIPLGKLTVDDEVVTFEPVDCGNIIIGHCAGTLSHTRA